MDSVKANTSVLTVDLENAYQEWKTKDEGELNLDTDHIRAMLDVLEACAARLLDIVKDIPEASG
jgi:hypothetical protein